MTANGRGSPSGSPTRLFCLGRLRKVPRVPGWWLAPHWKTGLELAKTDDERPARYALVRTVLDWYRTDIGQPISAQTAVTLTAFCLGEEELCQEASTKKSRTLWRGRWNR